MKNKKILILALVLLIVAGIVVIGLKGFEVDFMLKQHNSIEYYTDQAYDIKDIEDICKDAFGDKKYELREIEFFNTSISINAETITTEEADKLVAALDAKYKNGENKTEEGTQENQKTNYTIITNPKIKLSSLVKPFIVPAIIVAVILALYSYIRFSKLGAMKSVINLIATVLLTILSIISVIAIARIPVCICVIPFVMICVLISMIVFFYKNEQSLAKVNSSDEVSENK